MKPVYNYDIKRMKLSKRFPIVEIRSSNSIAARGNLLPDGLFTIRKKNNLAHFREGPRKREHPAHVTQTEREVAFGYDSNSDHALPLGRPSSKACFNLAVLLACPF